MTQTVELCCVVFVVMYLLRCVGVGSVRFGPVRSGPVRSGPVGLGCNPPVVFQFYKD